MLGIEHTSRYDFTADLFRSIMSCPKCNKDVVPERDKNTVGRPVSLGPEDIAPALRPPFPILPCVRLVDWLACSSARLAKFSYLFNRNAQSIAIGKGRFRLRTLQHGFLHFWDMLDILDTPDAFRLDLGFFIELE
jgi:hypothetical protein